MPFVPSSYAQRVLDLILQTLPKHPGTQTIATKPKPNRLRPLGDPYQCSSTDIAAIRSALDAMARIYLPVIYTWPGAGKELANRLAGLSEETIWIGCGECKGFGSDSRTLNNPTGKIKYAIDICADVAYNSNVASVRRDFIELSVFLELIALAGGTGFDQYCLYTYFVTSNQGQNGLGPLPLYLAFMCAASFPVLTSSGSPTGLRAGTFMVWDPVSGVFGVGNDVNPQWFAIILDQNFSDPAWQHPCP